MDADQFIYGVLALSPVFECCGHEIVTIIEKVRSFRNQLVRKMPLFRNLKVTSC